MDASECGNEIVHQFLDNDHTQLCELTQSCVNGVQSAGHVILHVDVTHSTSVLYLGFGCWLGCCKLPVPWKQTWLACFIVGVSLIHVSFVSMFFCAQCDQAVYVFMKSCVVFEGLCGKALPWLLCWPLMYAWCMLFYMCFWAASVESTWASQPTKR